VNDWLPGLLLLFFFCILPLGAGLIVVYLVWRVRRSSFRESAFEATIKMDSATCLKTRDGTVVVRRFNRGLMALLGVALILILGGLGTVIWDDLSKLVRGEVAFDLYDFARNLETISKLILASIFRLKIAILYMNSWVLR